MAGEEIVDDLQCLDIKYDEPDLSVVHEAAINTVEEEKCCNSPSENGQESLQLPIIKSETELMHNEFETLKQHLPMEQTNLKGLEPSILSADVTSKIECIENSMAQFEHHAIKIKNLELMMDHGTETWKSYLEELIKCVYFVQSHFANLHKHIQEIIVHRNNVKFENGEKSRNMEASWVALANKNHEIELACARLEKQLDLFELEN